MKVVKFFTIRNETEVEVCRVWCENGKLTGSGNEIWLNDLQDWFEKSEESVEDYLESLHQRFDGTFLFAGRYEEVEEHQ